ncbi:SEC-C domain-containing protein [Mycolicibacterium smegmatis]|uniref:YecA family protein n=1 Tax=Mycolicibacterium smegmatis TaxID=1772 RepID=UPI001EFA9AB3|nr:SEC-C metal-binding domain-containing protein [Mycolicibacterium smegmatis]ULN30125.1 SEC-C domain-containing protein [Mycolicibacterium smegmatis]
MATVTDAVARILAEQGPLHTDEIERLLQASGEPVPEPVVDELSMPVGMLVDDRWVWLPTVLDGRVFTHRLSAHEVAHDMLDAAVDLDPVSDLFHLDEYLRLADGSPVSFAVADYDDELLEDRGIPLELAGESGVVLLAPRTLAALKAAEGDLVGLRLTDQGLALETIETVVDADIGNRLAEVLPGDEPTFVDAAALTLCAEDPTVFVEATAPLSEVIREAGLAYSDGFIAPAGFDFGRWRFETACHRSADTHGLDPDDAVALQTLIMALEQLTVDADSLPLLRRAGAALENPVVADALVEKTVDAGRGSPESLSRLTEALEAQVPRPARAAVRWLRATALERAGDIAAAERELLAAETMDTEWPLTLVDLAHIASDRGDAERALALLRRAGFPPDHPNVQFLQRYLVAPRPDLGRNEPCWCGSGRKYKKCHLGNEQLSLEERAAWLYSKAAQHVSETHWHGMLLELALERSRYADDLHDAIAEAMSDPLVMDALLHEGDAFADFLRVRGPLLPDDERALAEQWLLVDRSVFEVQAVRPGETVTVRDVRTGDRHEVRERLASREVKPGELLCARVLPTGSIMQFFGGIERVSLGERDELIELLDSRPDEVTLVAALTRRFAPPTLTNTEGDLLMVCEAAVRFADPAALDAVYVRADDDPPHWFEHVPGKPQIRASLKLDGDTLRVETNSEERMDRVLAELGRLDPAMTVLEESRRPISEVTPPSRELLEPDDPEMIAAMEEFMRDYETRWLDESIPALNGLTPRQAADDPTRRGDLIKLLDSFPATERGMNADRLRAALGLD